MFNSGANHIMVAWNNTATFYGTFPWWIDVCMV